MPESLERKLKAKAKKKGYGKKRTGAYVYGALRKTGWRPRRERVLANKSRIRRKRLRKR